MTAAAHTFPNFNQLMGTKAIGGSLNASSHLGTLLVASGTFNWVAATQAYTTVSAFLTNAGSGGGGALTEVSGGGYSRQALASPTLTTSGLVTSLACTTPISYTSSTITALYLLLFDFTAGGTISANDATAVPIAYQDFGAAETDTAGTWTFTPASNVWATWTAS